MMSDFQTFVDSLRPDQINFIASLTEEELKYMKKIAKQTYEGMEPNKNINKIMALTYHENMSITKLGTAEERNVEGLRHMFSEYDKFAGLTDAAFGEVVSEELWAHQGLFTRESAMLESIVDRLKRSTNGNLKPVMFLEFEALEANNAGK
jgi:hypothetical protein